MQLQPSDVAALFEVPENTVFKWIRAGEIPVHVVNSEYRFSRAELLEWATTTHRPVPPRLFAESGIPPLADALERGGVHANVPGGTLQAVLSAVVERLPLPPDADRASVLAMLLARERSGTTAVGHGVALPHVRSPLVLTQDEPQVAVCYLAAPVDFDAPDGQPVSTLITLVTPTVRVHLQLLARLAYALRTPDFKAALESRAGLEVLMRAARKAESQATSG